MGQENPIQHAPKLNLFQHVSWQGMRRENFGQEKGRHFSSKTPVYIAWLRSPLLGPKFPYRSNLYKFEKNRESFTKVFNFV